MESQRMLSFYENAADYKDYIKLMRTKYRIEFSKGHSPHFHNSVEIVFMLQGSCTLRINADTKVLTEGDIAFIGSFDVHHYVQTKGCEYFVVLISSDFFDGNNRLEHIAFPHFPEKTDGFSRIIDFLCFCEKEWENATPLFKVGFVNLLLGMMVSMYPTEEAKKERQSEALILALRYINENFTTDISIESVASFVGYTPNYFSAIFNSLVGMSFREYLNRCRIIEFDRIKKKTPTISTAEAMRMCGFTSPNTFYRAYTKYKRSDINP